MISKRSISLGILASAAIVLITASCQSLPQNKPIRTEASVDLDRFMGDWFVIANIPTFIEKKAYNAVESYERKSAKVIATTFKFRKGSPEGKLKTYRPTAFVTDDPSNSIWGMRFIWPFRADYRIIYVDSEYRLTIVGRSKRDYVWIMAREPKVDAETYAELLSIVEEQGYNLGKVQLVPQEW